MDTKSPISGRRLSGVDAAFLYLESKELPLHMACVCVFDGAIPFEKFVNNIDSKLHLIPRYRQIVVAPPYDADYPIWEDDPNFDIRRHIFQVRLDSPGGEPELEALAGRILSEVMDRSKPLWDLHVIYGLQGGRGALIARVHHALADGIAGIALMNIILDPTPHGYRTIGKPQAQVVREPPPEPSLAEAITRGILNSLENFIAAESSILEFVRAVSGDQSGLKEAACFLPEVVGAVERLPFNKPCGGERKFCWAEFDFAEAQAIRKAAGGSINDVILAVLTRAIARYVELHGQNVVNRLIRIVCPVNLRKDHDEAMGNQISFLPVVLPLDVEDPVRMLQAVAVRTAAMKGARAADLVALVAGWLGISPPPVQAMMWRGISQVMLPVPLLNMICTNIPGSVEPLYCLGKRMIASYPQVPTGYELGINCAVQSYDGKLFFGLIADAKVAEDVTRLRDLLQVSFNELCLATGVRKPTRPRRTKPAQPVAAKVRKRSVAHAAPLASRKARSRRAKPVEPAAEVELEPSPEVIGEPAPAPSAMSVEAGA